MDAVTGHAPMEPHIKVAIHGHFYRWARSWVSGKVVLDSGCGNGSGAAILAESAEKIVGVDIDHALIDLASNNYVLPNLSFEVMDCQNLTFPPHSFDVVVSNALLEYLQDVGSFFQGARQLLKPGGVMICGTKNLLLSLKKPDGTPRYNNHLQEFTPEGLAAELGRHFGSVTIFGEQMNSRSEAYIMNPRALRLENQLVKLNVKRLFPRRLRRWVRKLVTGVDLNEIDYEDFEITEQNIESALYLIGTGIKSES